MLPSSKKILSDDLNRIFFYLLKEQIASTLIISQGFSNLSVYLIQSQSSMQEGKPLGMLVSAPLCAKPGSNALHLCSFIYVS